MKLKLFALFALLGLMSFADEASLARMTIYPFRQERVPVSLVKEKDNPIFSSDGNWVKDSVERKATLLMQDPNKPLSTESWTPFRATFRADGNGNVTVAFQGRYAADAENRQWVFVRHIKINGVKWKDNYEFKKTYSHKTTQKTIPLGFWFEGKKAVLQEDAGDGKPAMLINHDNRLCLMLPVEEGKTYTIEAEFQAAFPPLE